MQYLGQVPPPTSRLDINETLPSPQTLDLLRKKKDKGKKRRPNSQRMRIGTADLKRMHRRGDGVRTKLSSTIQTLHQKEGHKTKVDLMLVRELQF